MWQAVRLCICVCVCSVFVRAFANSFMEIRNFFGISILEFHIIECLHTTAHHWRNEATDECVRVRVYSVCEFGVWTRGEWRICFVLQVAPGRWQNLPDTFPGQAILVAILDRFRGLYCKAAKKMAQNKHFTVLVLVNPFPNHLTRSFDMLSVCVIFFSTRLAVFSLHFLFPIFRQQISWYRKYDNPTDEHVRRTHCIDCWINYFNSLTMSFGFELV